MAGLRGERLFARWATAEGISMVGSAVTTVVLPLVVYEATGSATKTGLLFALRVIPYLVFGVIAGPVADRGNRRFLIIGGNLAEGVLVATIPIAQIFGVLTIGQIYAVGLLSATAFVFSDAAVFGAVPALVGRDKIAAANGLLASLASSAEILGPALGGLLAALITPTNAIWIDSASFFVAAGVLSSIPSNFRESNAVATASIAVRAQIRRALGFVRRQRTVLTLLLVGFGNSLGFGAVLGLTVPYAVEQLGLDRDDGRIGLLYSVGGVGSLIAGLLLSRLFRTERVRWITPSAVAFSAVMATGLAATTRFGVAMVLMCAFSWSVGITISVGITYRQLAAPDDLRSSVNVFGRMISWGGQPFGAALGALIAGAVTVRAAYVAAASVMIVSAAAAAFFLPRSTRLPEP